MMNYLLSVVHLLCDSDKWNKNVFHKKFVFKENVWLIHKIS